ncbi:uncharacterized protein APUU_41340S [Aspergillus puulaauensis]|uniref:Zn(2)-C6 fungal-type domain-containing protein n=1 Tax=Aspergillus puulaauensis TaxID=1220207 RepID=A0A7R8AMZ4_9EURO|nr:uncharacterized protein APUU_41340S [Aspergillus puulaauensis]BCS24896.1 hypothetical protein APUU_41340S [Aspergillus puulaauensis]
MDDQDLVHQRKRRRAKVACDPCRERKRKCDGRQPCGTCTRLEYDCSYKGMAVQVRNIPSASSNSFGAAIESSASTGQPDERRKRKHQSSAPGVDVHRHVQLLEANSGAAFVRKLGLHIDPSNAPRLHLFAWNTGERLARCAPGAVRPVISMLTAAEMTRLALIYFDKVAETYGFIDRSLFFKRLHARWNTSGSNTAYDSVFCGVAALALHFSERFPMAFEPDLVETAKTLLEQNSLQTPPSVDTVKGWILRVAYLRMTSTPHATWLASCSLMHVAEAANIHLEGHLETVFNDNPSETIALDLRRRLWGLAQHFNIWASFDLGRSRITLSGACTTKPVDAEPAASASASEAPPGSIGTPGDSTSQILSLVPLTERLDPNKPRSVEELENDIIQVLAEARGAPTATMSQVNLMLCIFRRLRAQGSIDTLHPHMDRIIALAMKGLDASLSMVASYSPWHHAANIPFQVVCLLLAIDSQASLGLLGRAMGVLRAVRDRWDSAVMREAYSTAVLLVYLHQRRKEDDARSLRGVLEVYSTTASTPGELGSASASASASAGLDADMGMGGAEIGVDAPQQDWTAAYAAEVSWLGNLVSDMPALREIDVEQFLMQPGGGGGFSI